MSLILVRVRGSEGRRHESIWGGGGVREVRGQILSPSLGDKVDSGIGLSMVNVLESTLESTLDEVIVVNSGIGSPYTMFLFFEYSLWNARSMFHHKIIIKIKPYLQKRCH